MKTVELLFHEHPLLPITRFSGDGCKGCGSEGYIYGGYRCNELGCEAMFHKECAESSPKIEHPLHPDHPLTLLQRDNRLSRCSRCNNSFEHVYICSICDFKLDLRCAQLTAQILEVSNLHEHPLKIFSSTGDNICRICFKLFLPCELYYNCEYCHKDFHGECAALFPEASHSSHPQHHLEKLSFYKADYADEKCLLCGINSVGGNKFKEFHHCKVCNFSICKACMINPPPVDVESPTTHEHQLHLFSKRINFTCNACGTLGDRSPYVCLQCNFMIHRECIDLPRVININHHDHRIYYTRRLHDYTASFTLGEKWECKVCRNKIDGFYGAYVCHKCPSFAVHLLCATSRDVWDMIELEDISEEEELAPFEVIDANTIKHFSHHHDLLRLNNDGHDWNLLESTVCEACRLQILSEPFYICEQCAFILHDKCANHPRKKRHVHCNQPFTLRTDSRHEVDICVICWKRFTGFRYEVRRMQHNRYPMIMDVRCAAIADTLKHESHQHHLYYCKDSKHPKSCSRCGNEGDYFYHCDECNYTLDGKCAHLPKEVMRKRYDDHPLSLSFGEMNVDVDYWCEACETKVNPKEWFYTCNNCGTTLHISCVVGDFSYIMPGFLQRNNYVSNYILANCVEESSDEESSDAEVVSNNSICRPLCSGWRCNSRCMLSSICKVPKDGVDEYFCSIDCINYY